MLKQVEERYGAFVPLDVHSYNHRRDGADAMPPPQDKAADMNIGTIAMDRDRWADAIEATIKHFSTAQIGGRHLDVRENVALYGKGEQTRFVHERFLENGCAIATEFKKIFKDEWTSEPDAQLIHEIRDDFPPGLMVPCNKPLVSRHTVMEKRRLNALLHHEIGVHLLTYFIGSVQSLRLFRTGLYGCAAMRTGADFLNTYRIMTRDHGFDDAAALTWC